MTDTNKNPIAVIGAGAIGCVVGGLLAREGREVVLIGRPTQAEAINRDGLKLSGVPGDLTIEVRAAETLDFQPSLVLLAVKSQDVVEALTPVKDLIAGVPVVTMQNGLRADLDAAEVVGREQVIGCVVFFSASYLSPGRVTYTRQGTLMIGSEWCGRSVLDRTAQVLSRAIPTTVTGDIGGARRTKLILNVMGNSVDAMTGQPIAEVAQDPRCRRLIMRLMKEALSVVEKSGGKLVSLPGLNAVFFKTAIKLPLRLGSLIVMVMLKGEVNESSTLQSIRRGRPVEAAYISGEIVELARAGGLSAPLNQRVFETIEQVAATGKFLTVDELASRFPET